jgi:3-isopropylmalate/(R)-2-methylmalate dehydratase small subunit
MEAFVTLESTAIRLEGANVDTDQIIPARFLRNPRKAGYAGYLFHDLRFDSDGKPVGAFAFNRPENEGARIVIADENFGCGSSREGAVYALWDYGIRCVIAPSFGDIFRNNCAKNGMLPVVMSTVDIDRLLATAAPGTAPRLRVDLPNQVVTAGDIGVRFDIEPFWKDCLLSGLDDIDLTLRHRARIAAFAAERFERHPWLVPGTPS